MAMSNFSMALPPQHEPRSSRVASFASLSTPAGALNQGTDRVFDASESSEDRRLFTIVHGVREDCIRLLQQFEARQSLRFNDFSACWRDMMFSHILSGRTIVAERIEYLQKTMAIAVRLFVNGQDIIRKVGALYLMYGLYMKIGAGERILVGIRVTPLVWAALKEVRELAVQQNHHDVLFVIDKLLFMSAFVFVAQDRELAPDLLHRSAKTDAGDEDAGYELEEESPLQEYLEDGGLQQLSTLHTKYEAIKQQLFKGANIERISFLGADVAPDIQRRLEAIIKGKAPAAAEAAAEQDKPTTLTGRRGARERALARFRDEPAPQSPPDEGPESASSADEHTAETSPPPSPPKRARGRGGRPVGTSARGGAAKGRGAGAKAGPTGPEAVARGPKADDPGPGTSDAGAGPSSPSRETVSSDGNGMSLGDSSPPETPSPRGRGSRRGSRGRPGRAKIPTSRGRGSRGADQGRESPDGSPPARGRGSRGLSRGRPGGRAKIPTSRGRGRKGADRRGSTSPENSPSTRGRGGRGSSRRRSRGLSMSPSRGRGRRGDSQGRVQSPGASSPSRGRPKRAASSSPWMGRNEGPEASQSSTNPSEVELVMVEEVASPTRDRGRGSSTGGRARGRGRGRGRDRGRGRGRGRGSAAQ